MSIRIQNNDLVCSSDAAFSHAFKRAFGVPRPSGLHRDEKTSLCKFRWKRRRSSMGHLKLSSRLH